MPRKIEDLLTVVVIGNIDTRLDTNMIDILLKYQNKKVAMVLCIIDTSEYNKKIATISGVTLYNFSQFFSLSRKDVKAIVKEFISNNGLGYKMDRIRVE